MKQFEAGKYTEDCERIDKKIVKAIGNEQVTLVLAVMMNMIIHSLIDNGCDRTFDGIIEYMKTKYADGKSKKKG